MIIIENDTYQQVKHRGFRGKNNPSTNSTVGPHILCAIQYGT